MVLLNPSLQKETLPGECRCQGPALNWKLGPVAGTTFKASGHGDLFIWCRFLLITTTAHCYCPKGCPWLVLPKWTLKPSLSCFSLSHMSILSIVTLLTALEHTARKPSLFSQTMVCISAFPSAAWDAGVIIMSALQAG